MSNLWETAGGKVFSLTPTTPIIFFFFNQNTIFHFICDKVSTMSRVCEWMKKASFLLHYVFMSPRLVSFQCIYGWAELLTVRTIVASSADVLGLDMFIQSGFVFGCPAAGETVPPLLCPHHAARYYVFYFHVSCNTRHNKQRSKFGIINFNQVRGPTASLLVYIWHNHINFT